MTRRFLFAKIRDIQITQSNLNYEGSIKLDSEWLEKTGMRPFEEVTVLNVANGNRFNTYIIEGAPGSGAVELNGPAARLGQVGDPIMVLSYCDLHSDEIENHSPHILCVNPRT